ncbi:hypothetical protein ACHAPU_009586 [Fusarium lateritium]
MTQTPTSPGPARKTRTARSKYVPRACQECHRRRKKCDGQRPLCSRCLARGLSCTFSANVDHRGSAPRSYVTLLHTRIHLLEQVLRLHNIDIDASIACITSQKPETLPRGCQPLQPSDLESPKASETAPYCPPPSGDPTYGERDAPFFGLTSGRLELPERPDAGLGPEVKSPDKPQITVQNYPQEPPWLQVVDEALFRDSWRNSDRYHSALLLDCIMALASRYSDRPQVRSDPRDPESASNAFIQLAEARLQSELKWPSITTVQSLAIMATFYVVRGSKALAVTKTVMLTTCRLLGLTLQAGCITEWRSGLFLTWASTSIALGLLARVGCLKPNFNFDDRSTGHCIVQINSGPAIPVGSALCWTPKDLFP